MMFLGESSLTRALKEEINTLVRDQGCWWPSVWLHLGPGEFSVLYAGLDSARSLPGSPPAAGDFLMSLS